MSGRKLTVDEKHTAEELYAYYNNTPNPQIARRFQALALLQRGRTLKETAAIVGVSIRAVQKWRTGYRTGGLNTITRRTRGGNRIPVRPRLTPDQQAQLLQHTTTQVRRAFARSARQWRGVARHWAWSCRSVRCDGSSIGWGFGARYRVRWRRVRTLRCRRSGNKGVWRGVDGAGGARGAAGGVCGRDAGGVDWSGASALDRAWGQVVSAGGAFVQVAVLVGSR
jgi:hypothetical protein